MCLKIVELGLKNKKALVQVAASDAIGAISYFQDCSPEAKKYLAGCQSIKLLPRLASTLALGRLDYQSHSQYLTEATRQLLDIVSVEKVGQPHNRLPLDREYQLLFLHQLPKPEVEVRRASYESLVLVAQQHHLQGK